ncbi:DUF262 domain-containing protein [Aquimarina sp. MMG015]|uniref:DUF262 domain-containing protein n=1 Tax=Aquimarina sp. MMG015 TaxID=2822689 RepID=UPI001B39FF53|nr:DUF262 domain-containing protein [Aquimarina sp. MMG015]MBQ4804013.1 DUF262 domain-containing protein [Aquimarina sp. MMG015]
MESSLESLSKLFTERIYRIPDYQRGYAWTNKQLKDFWADLVQLDKGKNHYIGVLTVEEVSEGQYKKWDDDLWIIESKSYRPLYIVDGQQRLTTSIILIQAITEFIPENEKLNYNTVNEIRKKYIYESKDEGISRSYIFGYEKDNPSYDYLKLKIFKENLEEFSSEPETIYTNNLEKAKEYFIEQLSLLNFKQIEDIYKKLTQNFLFNSYSISSDIDVFIAFETMNNRGKPLSYLELLKNRLIYLSTKFEVSESEKNKLRKRVNECWKSIYHNLGRNKNQPLDDDQFLRNHFLIYFGRKIFDEVKTDFTEEISFQYFLMSRRTRKNLEYPIFLLEKHFVTKNILCDNLPTGITIKNVYEYVNSLQKSVETWYKIFNPKLENYFTLEETKWLSKLNRRSITTVAVLIMVFFEIEKSEKKRVKLLKALERFSFIKTMTYLYRYSLQHANFVMLSTDLIENKISSDKLIQLIVDRNNKSYNDSENKKDIRKSFKNNGFYKWDGIHYFLYEYDLTLYEKSKTKREKLNWDQFNDSDYKTVEHIFPQNGRKECWKKHFSKYTSKERRILRHSLGNLVPLSQPKNSSFQNKCFKDKIANSENTVGFRFGSYSENELTENTEWTATQILERGIRLLSFLEKRWELPIGNIKQKIEFLNLGFVLEKEKIKLADLTTANNVYKK